MKTKKILDETNRIILSELSKNGRTKFTTLAKMLKVTPAAVKERIERLIDKTLIKVSVLFNTEMLYPITAVIGIETDSEGVDILVKKLRNCPLILQMTRTSGMHNLIINMVADDVTHIERFLNNHVRSEPGIRHVEVNIGNSPVVPEFHQLRICYPQPLETAPCGLRPDDKEVCLNCPVLAIKDEDQ